MVYYGHQDTTGIPVAGRVATTALSLFTLALLVFCLTRRIQHVPSWKTLSLPGWLLILIYIDSSGFIFASAVLSKSWSLNESLVVCESVIFLCLTFYLSTKVLVYYFLVEKVYIIRGSLLPRFKNKLWLFNFFGVILPYLILIVVNFLYRQARITPNGVCFITLGRKALVPLITFEVLINVYLTSLFIHPLRQLYSYKHKTSSALRRMAFRTFIGSCSTLVSSVTNMTVLTVLDGEAAWICLMLCNLDVLFSVIVLHWATSVDRENGGSTSATLPNAAFSSQSRKTDQYSGTRSGIPSDRRARVTTNIEANKSSHSEDDDEIAMDTIAVKTHQVQEVEMSNATPRTSHSNEYYMQRTGSEDAIVRHGD